MNRMRVISSAALVVFAACGELERDGEAGRTGMAVEALTASACGDADRKDVEWAGIASDDQKICSGRWEYGGQCCTFGAQDSVSCAHADRAANVTFTHNQRPASCSTFCVRSGNTCQQPQRSPTVAASASASAPQACFNICLEYRTTCSYRDCGAEFGAADLNAVNSTWNSGCTWGGGDSRPVPALTYASGSTTISYGGNLGGTRTCAVTVSNAPVSHAGVENSCGAAKHFRVCEKDSTTVKYAACTSVGSMNEDQSIQALDYSSKCAAQGRPVDKQYLPEGSSLAALNRLPLEQTRDDARCMTGEDVVTAGTTPAAKFDSLLKVFDSLPEGSNDAALAANHVKLLFEFSGTQLRDDQRASPSLLNAYELYPAAPQCGSRWEGAPPDAMAPMLGLITGDLLLCQRVTDPHTGATEEGGSLLADQMSDFCASTVQKAKFVLGTSNAAAYTEQAARVAADALKAGFLLQPDPSNPIPVLQRRLWTLGRWYDAARSPWAYSDPNASAKLWTDASAVAGSIWLSTHQDERAALVESKTKSEAEVEALLTSGFASDGQILRALLSDYVAPGTTDAAPPLSSGPALILLADGVRSMTERLDAMSRYHDLGCVFMPCATTKTQVGIRTELSTLYQLVGALPSKADLDAALAAGDAAMAARSEYFSDARWTPWRNLFALVSRYHESVVEPAVAEASQNWSGYDPKWVTGVKPDEAAPLVGFAEVASNGARRALDYAATGQFGYYGSPALTTGLLKEKFDQIQANVKSISDRLDSEIKDYQDSRATLISNLTNTNDTEIAMADLLARRDYLTTQIVNVGTDDEGLRMTADLDQLRFSDVARRIQEVLAVLEKEGAAYTPTTILKGKALYGKDARWSGGLASPTAIAIENLTASGQSRLEHGEPGDILWLEVTGTWQPTCALQAQKESFFGGEITGKDASGHPVDVALVTTGPAGYGVSISAGTAYATSHTFAKTESWSANVSLCGSAGKGSENGVNKLALSACAGWSGSRTTTDSRSTSYESSTKAMFASGLRLPNTPFSDFPAGSLVAVMVDPSDSSKVLDAVVVQDPTTAITFPQAADVYLVVNDNNCGEVGNSALSLTAVMLRPSGDKAYAIAQAMQTVWNTMQKEADGIVAQGTLLPDQANGYRNSAWQNLRTECSKKLGQPCEPSQYPPVLYGFFQTWIDAKVVELERRAQHARNRRTMDQLVRDLRAIQDELDATERKGRLVKLAPMWSLQNLNLANEHLKPWTDEYMKTIREQLLPLVGLRYPEALDGVIGADALLKYDWYNADVATLSKTVKELGDGLLSSLSKQIGDAGAATAWAILRFPKPSAPQPSPDSIPLPGRTIQDGRETEIWKAIESAQPFTLTITPEDLYQSGTNNTLLPCTLSAPAITKMAFYVVTTSPSAPRLNTQDVTAPTAIQPELHFPTGRGIENIIELNEDWRAWSTKILYGKAPDGELSASQYVLSGPLGVSPITTWHFDSLGNASVNYGDPFSDATELLIVLEVQGRNLAEGVEGVATCPTHPAQ